MRGYACHMARRRQGPACVVARSRGEGDGCSPTRRRFSMPRRAAPPRRNPAPDTRDAREEHRLRRCGFASDTSPIAHILPLAPAPPPRSPPRRPTRSIGEERLAARQIYGLEPADPETQPRNTDSPISGEPCAGDPRRPPRKRRAGDVHGRPPRPRTVTVTVTSATRSPCTTRLRDRLATKAASFVDRDLRGRAARSADERECCRDRGVRDETSDAAAADADVDRAQRHATCLRH